MTAPVDTAGLRGKLTADAQLAKLVWFKSGGAADWLFEPADLTDLELFLEHGVGEELRLAVPCLALLDGVGADQLVNLAVLLDPRGNAPARAFRDGLGVDCETVVIFGLGLCRGGIAAAATEQAGK